MLRKAQHLLVSLGLLAILAMTQAMSAARADVPPAGQMVICTGLGYVTVHFDEDGQPVDAPMVCPDLGQNMLAADAAPPLVPVAAGAVWQEAFPSAHAQLVVPAIDRWTAARGPPAA